MAWSFNPFTGNLDLTGSSGAVVFEGEVETFADLPEVVGDPPVGSSYLVRTSTGVWLVNKRQSGIWIRRNNTGVRATDWEYGGDYPVNSVNGQSGNVVLSASDVGAPPTSRTITAGAGLTGGGDFSANRTLAVSFGTTAGTACEGNDSRLSDARTPTAHAASHAAAGSDPLTIEYSQVSDFTDGVFNNNAGSASALFDVSQGDLGMTMSDGSVTIVSPTENGDFNVTINPTGVTANRNYDLPDRSGELALVSDITKTAVGLGNVTNNAQVTSVSGTAPIVSSGGTTPTISVTTGTTAGTVAAGDHTHTQLHDRSHAITSTSDHTATANRVFYSNNSGQVTELALGAANTVLTSNGTTSAPSFAAVSGVISGSVDNAILRADGVGGSTSQGSDINIEDATISTQANVAITNQHSGQTNSALVLTPKGTGAFIVGSKPDGTSTGGNSRGLRAINISLTRSASTQVASGTDSIAIGSNVTASNTDSTAVGNLSNASGSASSSYGRNASAAGVYATAIGYNTSASAAQSISIGKATTANAGQAIAIGQDSTASGLNSIAIGEFSTASAAYACGINASASLRSQFAARPFSSIYWSGTTTNNTVTILNLDGTATNRFTIAANTALAVDILLVARRSDVSDKWLVARRFLGIRRDGSNNTALIGTVQTLGTDQSAGSPTWSFALTADDANEALQLEVTGATGETVQWAATATYRVV